MTNPWKITTIALGATIATALTSGLTTAYLLRATAPAASVDVAHAPARLVAAEPVTEPRRAPIVRVTRAPQPPPPRPAPVARVEPDAAPAPVAVATVADPDPAPVTRAPQPAEPAVAAASPAATSATPGDCATGGDRAWRIAKPGAIGTLVGAGVGAAGGAIADGGSGAGKGALWGGLAGAALGTGWGAYKTKQECGTIFGDANTR